MQSQCFILLKPDAHRRGLVGEILSRFERRGYTIDSMTHISQPNRGRIEEFYSKYRENNFFEEIVQFMMGGPVTAIVLNGNPDLVRAIVGDTYPHKCEPGSIRGDLASSIVENLIHCSTGEEAEVEAELWSL
jgi:nucleoside-diphosphate kinase